MVRFPVQGGVLPEGTEAGPRGPASSHTLKSSEFTLCNVGKPERRIFDKAVRLV
jgi:hypothetical protein